MLDMTKAQVESKASYHHTSFYRGYVRVNTEIIEEYEGRFGKGYTIKSNNSKSSLYCFIHYYIV